MTFILAAERDADVVAAFANYRAYLAALRDRFPPSAYALATSEWYCDPGDHRSPHDAWLQAADLTEPACGEGREERTVSLRLRLLGAYHDGHVELVYPKVFRYELELTDGQLGHGDWRYDEFRLSEAGHLLHEIEWASAGHTGRWLIEASDARYAWLPSSTVLAADA